MITILGVVVFYVIPAILLLEVIRCVYLEHLENRIPILLYHRLVARRDVTEGRIPDHEPIYVAYGDTFAGQMAFLDEHGYAALSLDQFLQVRRGRARRPSRAVVLTFDDGYESNYRLAWPVLRRHHLKATIFVAPQPDEYTRRLVQGIDGFLSEAQMRELDRGGVAIESHTLTHCVLSELDDQAARYELGESKRRLQEILSRPVRHLAIPRSGYSLRIRRLAREAGYETVCCNGKGSSNAWSSLFALPRIVIERDMTVQDFARSLRPRRGVVLRLVGTVKRIPAWLIGSARTQRMRRALLSTPLGGLLVTRRLTAILAGLVALYALGVLLFTWYLLSR